MATTLVAAATVPMTSQFHKRSCGEKADLVCFGVNGGTAQNVNVDDVAYAASYLRYIAEENAGTAGAFFTMPPSNDCDEWQLPLAFGDSVMSLAKHINPRVNSSVLYEDIANAIDGGVDPTAESLAASLLGACGANGGMVGVKANLSNPAYSSASYVVGKGKPEAILVKIVHTPQ
ncbi:hypothetical protein KVR01_007759 [Diaporthe batatas]|uniref:uncharacterized protein n=1 Tax=Diaporthe batatas TaxID=748121 RepID=UPI001D03D65E|nr:uncharacterized protein KVR01_007759 [Diaporthe batatas]KAG8161994.1 hypothetical protein KVR01_007759 [Diaporthe batatas]